MKRLVLAAVMSIGAAAAAQAAPVLGLSDVTNNGGGSYTFTFDSVGGDIVGTGDGLSFSGGGISFLASANGGRVIQDAPANGGLGILGNNGGSDNLEISLGEILTLTFGQSVNILNFTLNGLRNGNGHQDAADGSLGVSADGQQFIGNAENFDGVAPDTVPVGVASICSVNPAFCSVSSLAFLADPAGDDFKGYLESITVELAPVPLPASLGFLALGLGGLAAVRRRARA
ncbi:VPLPA-CTERM sorting domain-containing protein [Jannaschia sp. CCS1]|uniref:VPLPA-CTERM sorting domain-containing protein n=1 Tax=Jannaschia sp. (strain CCS1) TaxID=290400 RepID=UPI000053AA9F|nr:VPLPA-CTERM sorting domain-containing protein [Jannaschia sp. CCS1]ABD54990.1 hypothetical protein Jann_2073 [Jannaschia sp. CCS1]